MGKRVPARAASRAGRSATSTTKAGAVAHRREHRSKRGRLLIRLVGAAGDLVSGGDDFLFIRVKFLPPSGFKCERGHDDGDGLLLANLNVRRRVFPGPETFQPVLHVTGCRDGGDRPRLRFLVPRAAFRCDGPIVYVHRRIRAMQQEARAGGIAKVHRIIEKEAFRVFENGLERVRVFPAILPNIDAAERHGGGRILRARQQADEIRIMRQPEAGMPLVQNR